MSIEIGDIWLLFVYIVASFAIGLLPVLFKGLRQVDMVKLSDFPGWQELTWKQKWKYRLTRKLD